MNINSAEYKQLINTIPKKIEPIVIRLDFPRDSSHSYSTISRQKRKYMMKVPNKILTCGHESRKYHAKGLCKNCYQRELEKRREERTGEKRKAKPVVYKCPHVIGQAYLNKMCKACCLQKGVRRGNKVTRCDHTDRPHYGKGMCKKCYRRLIYKVKQSDLL